MCVYVYTHICVIYLQNMCIYTHTYIFIYIYIYVCVYPKINKIPFASKGFQNHTSMCR